MMSSSCVESLLGALQTAGGDVATELAAMVGAICDEFDGMSAQLESHHATLASRTEAVATGLNTFFMLFGGAMVFIMHGGFALLEAGSIRSKNAKNVLLQTVLDAAVSAIMWYCVGFGFAFGIGDRPNKFIGNALFGLKSYESHFTGSGQGRWIDWFFQWAFCATATTIPAGAVAERFNFNAYIGYSMLLSGFVYPVVAHWAWCVTGWLGYGTLEPLFNAGYIDFAGSGVIHMTGGLTGLIAAKLVGPRLGRFSADGSINEIKGHSSILVVLGTVLLWFGWYGFNPVSALFIDTPSGATVASRSAVTTTLAGAAGGIICLAYHWARENVWDLVNCCNGILSGFVAITACCHVVEPWAAIICGACAGMVFEGFAALLLRLRIDDPLNAAPMHFGCGLFGVLFTGLLAKQEFIQQAYVHAPSAAATVSPEDMYPYGAFYPGSNGLLIASQVVGVLAIIGWVTGIMLPFFYCLKCFNVLRVSTEEETKGIDESKHGGNAYEK